MRQTGRFSPGRQLGQINRNNIHGAECSETDHQRALVDWANDTESLQTDAVKREALHWFHAIPNHAGRSRPFKTRGGRMLPPLEALALKAEGVKPGICDLRLDYVAKQGLSKRGFPTDNYTHQVCQYGLIAEMKKHGNHLTPEQRRYQEFMTAQGFLCFTWYTWQRGALEITKYLALERIAPIFIRDTPANSPDKLNQRGIRLVNNIELLFQLEHKIGK